MVVTREEVIVQSADAGEMEEGTAAVALAKAGSWRCVGGGGAVALGVDAGEVKAGEKSPERRVTVYKGSDVARAILDGGPEGEEKEREEEKCGKVGGKGGGRLAEELRRGAQVSQAEVIGHGAGDDP